MTLPRRAQMMLGAVGIFLLFGILGLAWWWWRHRPGCQPVTHLGRVRAALVVAGLVILAAGSAGRLVTGFQSLPACSPPGGPQAARSGRFDASLLAQEVATWPETGSRNQFERLAGLESGGYRHSGTGPVLGPAQLAVLSILAAIVVAILLRATRRARSLAGTPGAGTDRKTTEGLRPDE